MKTAIAIAVIVLNFPLYLIGGVAGMIACCLSGIKLGFDDGYKRFDDFMNNNMPL